MIKIMEIFLVVLMPIKKVEDIHEHSMRMASSHKLSENVKFKTEAHGKSMFKFKGAKNS